MTRPKEMPVMPWRTMRTMTRTREPLFGICRGDGQRDKGGRGRDMGREVRKDVKVINVKGVDVTCDGPDGGEEKN